MATICGCRTSSAGNTQPRQFTQAAIGRSGCRRDAPVPARSIRPRLKTCLIPTVWSSRQAAALHRMAAAREDKDQCMPNPVLAAQISAAELQPAPVEPSWVIEGEPVARSAVLSQSEITTTAVWDCTAGTFRWFFEVEETVHILEGEVVVTASDGAVHTLGEGAVASFQAGNWARWHVPRYVRKLAILREPVPVPHLVRLALRKALGRAQAALSGQARRR